MLRALFLVSVVSLACAGHHHWRRNALPPPPLPPGAAVPEPQWFKMQKLDHFSDSDNRTWQQRYFVNDSLWEPSSGPVFLMLGGEGPADPAWLATDTDIMRNAAKFKAMVIMLEHRRVVCSPAHSFTHSSLYVSVFPLAGTTEPATRRPMPRWPTWHTSPAGRLSEMLST